MPLVDRIRVLFVHADQIARKGLLRAGIEPADPMIAARSTAYPISYGRRHR